MGVNYAEGYWKPQPGPQVMASVSPADHTLFGGSRGGGKSDCLIGRHVYGAGRYGPAWNGLVVRRKYKDLQELRRRIDELITSGMPAERIGGETQVNYLRFKGGGNVTIAAFNRPEQLNDYVGHQFSEISFDEANTLPFFAIAVDKLLGSLRSPHGVPCSMFSTGNPGGPGHMQVKDYFRLGTGGHPARKPFITKIQGPFGQEFEEARVYIPSFLRDNKILCVNDPKYVARLMAISDPQLRKAWLDGDWDVFLGQAFQFRPDVHVVDSNTPIPPNAPMYMTMDWGYGAPCSIGWWWMDEDGCAYRFREWYVWSGKPNEGKRLSDSELAEGINQREKDWGINDCKIRRLAGPDCFAKKPNYQGGGQGPSTAEVFAANQIYITPGDPSRELKIRQFRERLRFELDDDGKVSRQPLLKVYRHCRHFIRTIPALAMDEDHPEDIDTEQEDHVYDESCHITMARPLALKLPPQKMSAHDRRIERLIRGGTSEYETMAYRESEETDRAMFGDEWSEGEDGERGDLIDTVY